MSENYKIAALYKFVTIKDCAILRSHLTAACETHGVHGTLLLAQEGINGTIAARPAGLDKFLDILRADPRFADIEIKYSYASEQPFLRMKVRLKQEIVTLRAPEADPNVVVGQYVEPQDWNDLIKNSNMLVIDTRNDYEYKIGTFENAIDPETASFTEFKQFVDGLKSKYPEGERPPIAMFCTGGIRCEKASAYMIEHGFDEVYHLKGGILKYLEVMPEEESLWHGECFVFDNRVAVKHGLEEGTHTLCFACRMPLSPEDRQSKDFKEGVSCPHCIKTHDEELRARHAERHRQVQLAKKRGEAHLGAAARKALRGK